MLTVRGNDTLRALVLAFKAADRDIRNSINRQTRATMSPVWKSLVELHATTRLDAAVIAKGAKITAGNPPVAVAASSTRKLKGGLSPAERWQSVEFGVVDRQKVTTYRSTSRRGRAYTARRHASRQLPTRHEKGRVAYQAFADIAPRLAALWAQIVVKTYMDAADKAAEGRG